MRRKRKAARCFQRPKQRYVLNLPTSFVASPHIPISDQWGYCHSVKAFEEYIEEVNATLKLYIRIYIYIYYVTYRKKNQFAIFINNTQKHINFDLHIILQQNIQYSLFFFHLITYFYFFCFLIHHITRTTDVRRSSRSQQQPPLSLGPSLTFSLFATTKKFKISKCRPLCGHAFTRNVT